MTFYTRSLVLIDTVVYTIDPVTRWSDGPLYPSLSSTRPTSSTTTRVPHPSHPHQHSHSSLAPSVGTSRGTAVGAHTGAPSISIFIDSDDEGDEGDEDHALEMEMKAVNRSRSG